MVQIILYQLVNVLPTAAISPNIVSRAALAMPGVEGFVQELPRINFIRKCRTVFRIIGETLEAYHIGKVEQWDQSLSDVMGRRHIAFQNLAIGVINKECLHTLILSNYIILEGKINEQQVEAVLSTIADFRKWLQRCAEVLEHSNSSYQTNIPYPRSMNIVRLGRISALMSDTCNGERDTRRLIVEQVHEAVKYFLKNDSDDIHILEVDFCNHIRNVWIGVMTKFLSTLLGNKLREEIRWDRIASDGLKNHQISALRYR